MGHKRKRSDNDEEKGISKELKRLKKEMRKQREKIKRLKKKRYDYSSDGSDSSRSSRQRSPLIPMDQLLLNQNIPVLNAGKEGLQAEQPDNNAPLSMRVTVAQEGSANGSTMIKDLSEKTGLSEDPVLDEKLLEAIGSCLDGEKKFAPAIHNDIFIRWKGILKEGLPKAEREEIFKKYLVPENCTIMEPPKLNAEVKASLLEPIITRDNRMVEKQRDISLCLAALGPLISNLLKNIVPDPMSLLVTLSDISRVLVDLQREESKTRRVIIAANLNASMKDTLNATVTDEWLFGQNLEEALKTAKSLVRSSKDLKQAEKTPTYSQHPKNLKGPSRQATRGRKASVSGQQRSAYQSYRQNSYQRGTNYPKTSLKGRPKHYRG